MREINLLEGKVVAKEGMKVAIVASRFNEIIVNKLLGGAVDGLVRHGVEENNITAAWVPGAFEIPVVAKKLACSKKYDAVICVGAVIRGDTCMQRGVKGCSTGWIRDRCSSTFRNCNNRKYRAGNRKSWKQSRKQRL